MEVHRDQKNYSVECDKQVPDYFERRGLLAQGIVRTPPRVDFLPDQVLKYDYACEKKQILGVESPDWGDEFPKSERIESRYEPKGWSVYPVANEVRRRTPKFIHSRAPPRRMRMVFSPFQQNHS